MNTRDVLLYVGIGLAIVASIALGLVYAPNLADYVFNKLLPMGVSAAVVFGYAIKDHRRRTKEISFWALLLALLAAHIAFWEWWMYPHFGVPRLLSLFAITMVEGIVVWSGLYAVFQTKPSGRRAKSGPRS